MTVQVHLWAGPHDGHTLEMLEPLPPGLHVSPAVALACHHECDHQPGEMFPAAPVYLLADRCERHATARYDYAPPGRTSGAEDGP